MNVFYLGLRLGDIKHSTFKRHYLNRHLESLEHDDSTIFNHLLSSSGNDVTKPPVAHKAGTNCIAIDQSLGRYLISGGADTAIRLWDLEQHQQLKDDEEHQHLYRPLASINKATLSAHSHSLTSLSIYPFDPMPTTLLSTSYDQSLLLTQITPTSLAPLHKFPLDFTAHCHAISPVPSAAPLVAVGTSHPAPRLIDLRSALATHALPGHTGQIWSLAWHPRKEHILLSSDTSGQILAFDIRRASPAFASFDSDDNLGVVETTRPQLDFGARAHGAPITGIVFNADGSKLVSASQDQRIRVWDVATGRNDLVHFGPRVRNSREGELKPVLAPLGTGGLKSGRELLFWPNDDGRGEIFVHEVREGGMVRVMKTKGVVQAAPTQGRRGKGRIAAGPGVGRLTSGGRISGLAFRPVRPGSEEGLGGSVEMFSAHGDGRICRWVPDGKEGMDEEEGSDDEDGEGPDMEGVETRKTKEELAADKSRKRKRDLIEGLVEGLTKRPITFS